MATNKTQPPRLDPVLSWDDIHRLAPHFVTLYPEDDVYELTDEDFALKVQAIACFYDSRFMPDNPETLGVLRQLIQDYREAHEETDIDAVGYC